MISSTLTREGVNVNGFVEFGSYQGKALTGLQSKDMERLQNSAAML
jgi:hypothetical protein